jgi:hypothetical protein
MAGQRFTPLGHNDWARRASARSLRPSPRTETRWEGSVALVGWSLLNRGAVGMKRRRSYPAVQIKASALLATGFA